jgi:hypothetical protein
MVSRRTAVHDEYGQSIHQDDPSAGVIKVRMLRQMWIGDINVNLTPGDEVEFVPGQYVKIAGERHRKMKSFLSIFRLQFGPNPDPETYTNPFFEILNSNECPDPYKVFGKSHLQGRPFATEEDRIRFEEGKGDATSRKVQVPGDVHDKLQLRGSLQATSQQSQVVGQPSVEQQGIATSKSRLGMSSRAATIHRMTADAIERPQGSNVGSGSTEPQEPQSVNDFQVSSQMAGGGAQVASIGGAPADEGRAAMAARRQSGVRQRR